MVAMHDFLLPWHYANSKVTITSNDPIQKRILIQQWSYNNAHPYKTMISNNAHPYKTMISPLYTNQKQIQPWNLILFITGAKCARNKGIPTNFNIKSNHHFNPNESIKYIKSNHHFNPNESTRPKIKKNKNPKY